MIKSRKIQLVMVLISMCACGLTLGAEPNEAKTELKFEISSEEQQWRVKAGRSMCEGPIITGTGPIEPSHFAEVFIMGDDLYTSIVGTVGIRFVSKGWVFPGTEGRKMILQTSAGRSTSQKQREFVETSSFIYGAYSSEVLNYSQYRLYAVSEMDAKRMVEAFCEILTEKANETMQEFKTHLHNTQERIANIKEKLPEKQKQAKEAESEYKDIKNARYSLLDDGEAYEKAKETMLQMDKMLDVLEIELAGIREKLGAINEYCKTPQNMQAIMRRKSLPDGMLVKLEQMLVEQMIEQRSLAARKEAALRIRNREKTFLYFSNQRANLEKEVNALERSLSKSEEDLFKLEIWLAEPKSNMLPPKVYQNKVTIYPVRVEED